MNIALPLSDKIQNRLFFLTVLATVCFLFYPKYLPMNDLPQHAAQVAALDDLLKHRSPWADMLQINWDTPYLTVYALWLALYQFMGINASSKALVSLEFLFFIYTAVKMRKEMGAERMTDWVALTCFFGFAFQWGFVGYIMGIPIGILFFITNKRWIENPSAKMLAAVSALGIWSYFSHILTFSFFCLLSYGYFLFRIKEIPWKQRFSLTAAYLFFAALLARYTAKPNPVPYKAFEDNFIQHSFWDKILEIAYLPWNMSVLFYYDIACLFLFAAPIAANCRPTREKSRYVPLLACLAVYFLMPHFTFQTSFLYERFALFVPIFYYLIWEKKPETPGRIAAKISEAACLLSALCIAALTGKAYLNNILFDRSQKLADFIKISQMMENGKKVLTVNDPLSISEGSLTSGGEFFHIAQWYQAERQGWADYSFASAHAMPVRMKMKEMYDGYSQVRFLSEYNLTRKTDCRRYDYLLILTANHTSDTLEKLLAANPSCSRVSRIKTIGEWSLFRRH